MRTRSKSCHLFRLLMQHPQLISFFPFKFLFRVCTSSGQWSGSAPVCRANVCGETPTVAHAVVETACAFEGCTSTYTCLPGFQAGLSSEQAITCTQGEWESPTLTCQAASCGVIAVRGGAEP